MTSTEPTQHQRVDERVEEGRIGEEVRVVLEADEAVVPGSSRL